MHHSSGHLEWQVRSDVPGVAECRSIWLDSGHTLEDVAEQLCDTCLDPWNNYSQQADAGITQTPAVWTMLEETDDPQSVEWLLNSYLWGDLAALKLLPTGVAVPLEHGETFSANIRVQTLINVISQRRSYYTSNPNAILPEHTVSRLFKDWKLDYTTWMNEAAQRDWYGLRVSRRHEWTRTRFRTFLFQMCGNYELIRFWVRVGVSWMSLRIFKRVFVNDDQETNKEIKLTRAVEAVRNALSNVDR